MVFSDTFQLSSRPTPPWACLMRLCPSLNPPDDVEPHEAATWTPSPYTPGEVTKLGLAEWSDRDGLVYVPRSYRCGEACPIVVTLHAEGADADEAMQVLLPFAEKHRLLLVAPDSRGETWSHASGMFNEDVAFIDKSLDVLFQNYSVQGNRVGLAGYRRGASFALDLGVRNGPVFSHVMAFSPTDADPPCYEDGPEIFISYPKTDFLGSTGKVCNPKSCPSVRVVPRLKSWGYNCRVHEFTPSPEITEGEGGQSGVGGKGSMVKRSKVGSQGRWEMGIPTEVVASAINWFSRGGNGSLLSSASCDADVEWREKRGKRGINLDARSLGFKGPGSRSCKM